MVNLPNPAPPASLTFQTDEPGSPEEQAHARILKQNAAQTAFNGKHKGGWRRTQRGGFPKYSSPDDAGKDQVPVPQFHTGVQPAGPQNANSASQIGGKNLAQSNAQANLDDTVPYTATKGTVPSDAPLVPPAAGGRRKTRRHKKKHRRRKTSRHKKKHRRRKTSRHKKKHRRRRTRRRTRRRKTRRR